MSNKRTFQDVLVRFCALVLAIVPCTEAAHSRRVLQVTRQGDVVSGSMLLNSAVAIESDGTFDTQNTMKDTSVALMVAPPSRQPAKRSVGRSLRSLRPTEEHEPFVASTPWTGEDKTQSRFLTQPPSAVEPGLLPTQGSSVKRGYRAPCQAFFDRRVLPYGDMESAKSAFHGRTITFMGDSTIRDLCMAFLQAFGRSDPSMYRDDKTIVVDPLGLNMTVQFKWRPYPEQLATEVETWTCRHGATSSRAGTTLAPDVAVMNSLLWHARIVQDPWDFEIKLKEYVHQADMLLEQCRSGSHKTQLWFALPVQSVPEQMKRPKENTSEMESIYLEVIQRQVFALKPSAHFQVDLRSVTQECGSTCTADGTHYCWGVSRVVVAMLIQNAAQIWHGTAF